MFLSYYMTRNASLNILDSSKSFLQDLYLVKKCQAKIQFIFFPDAYSKPCQTSKMESFAKIINSF